jgi:hypothetical protein
MIWYEFIVTVYDKTLSDIGVDSGKEVKAMVDLNQIYSFNQTFINDSGDECTLLNFSNGETMVVNESYEMVKKIMRCK